MGKILRSAVATRLLSLTRHDIMAALVVTALTIPQSLGLAVIAGLPPITGLYSAFLAPIVFGLLARTKRLVIGVSSATAALVASGAALVAHTGTADYTNAVIVLGILVGVVLGIVALLRLGLLADLISRPVMVGFLAGVGVQLIIMNIPALFGMPISSGVTGTIEHILQFGGSFNGMAATISLLVIGTVIIFRRSRVPGELVAIVLAMLFVMVFHASEYGVRLIGDLPSGLPSFATFHVDLTMILTLLPAAVALAVVALAQSAVLIRSSAAEHDEPVAMNRDLFALGVSNAVSAVTYGFTVNGSPPRTIAADSAGGKTGYVNVWSGLMVGVILLFGAQLFTVLPEAALASVICVLGYRLIRFGELKHIWDVHRPEFWVAVIALVGTAIFGVLIGVCVAVVVSLVERLARQYRPKDSILLADGELSAWATERIGRDRHLPKELLVYRFNGSLFFENIDYFVQRILKAVAATKHQVWVVVVDASAIDSIDYTAVGVLESFLRHLSADGISLGFAHVSPELMSQFTQYGISTLVGEDNIYSTLAAAIDRYREPRQSVEQRVASLDLPKHEYVLVGGSVLALLDLRPAPTVDIVVSQNVYDAFRAKGTWKEFTQVNGQKILSHDGRNLMLTWVGSTLKQLEGDTMMIQGVRTVSIEKLIRGKQRLGRRKDAADIKLLKHYRKHHTN